MSFLFPGGAIFSPPKMPSVAPPPPPPTREDPAVEEAKKRLKASEAQRKGRRASILAPPESELGDAPVERPEARGASVLGG